MAEKIKAMEYLKPNTCDFEISRITLGTWAIGGWMWGGTDEMDSINTVVKAIDKGVTTIDTAAVYGFGKSEELVGKGIKKYGKRQDVVLATKGGLEWDDNGKIRRNSTPERLKKEVDDSLRRLGTDYIDIYQIHWPDHDTDFAETANTLLTLQKEGKIRAIGVSNFSPDQMDEFRNSAPIHFCQPPYNLFEREIEADVKPYCQENDIALLTYGALCRGLLTGKMSENSTFEGDDLRQHDPKFKGKRYKEYLAAVKELQNFAKEQHNKGIIALAVRWILDKGVESAIWGARRPGQVDNVDEVMNWHLSKDDLKQIDEILQATISDPVGPEFMAPPA